VTCAIYYGFHILTSEGFFGGGDSLAHYRIAKFSLEHPMWLLDHWGKPFFTLMAFPFAQLGFKGIQVFNLLVGIITCLIAVDICKKNNWSNGWLAIPIILFTPIYFQEFFSGLTEAAFAMLVFMAIWLRLKNRYVLSLILLSFLPMVRTEAVLFLAWFGLLELIEKRFKTLPLLLTGTLIYSLVGWWAKGDILWLINEMPYSGGGSIYGNGSLMHYLQLMPEKIGWIVLCATAIGMVFLGFGLAKRENDSQWLVASILIPAVIYLSFHSIMWYLGKVSAGLPRILAVLVPFLAIVVVYAVHQLGNLFNSKLVSTGISISLCLLIVWNGNSSVRLPVGLGQEEKVLQRVADYIYENELDKNKIHYFALYNEVTLGLDPHYPENCQQVIHTRAEPHINVEANSLVIYDMHFAPNEGQMPLENLTSSPYFELLEVFEPETPFNTIGDKPYKVYLFYRKDITLP